MTLDAAPPRLRVWQLLLLAFGVRFTAGLLNDGALQPDELMQYLEQAHRLVFGAGMVPWEYDYGARSWAPALLVASVLEVTRGTGLDRPQIYQPAVEAFLSALSLAIPYSAYRLGCTLWSEAAGRLALVFTAFWYELVSYAHRATIDAVAAYPAFAALALACGEPRRTAVVACGLLAGASVVLRFQLAPVAAVIGAVALWRWRGRAWLAAAAALAVVVAGGALDAYTWGGWFASSLNSWDLNATHNLSATFGTRPGYWYFWTLLVLSGGLGVAGLTGLALSWRASWPLLAVAAATVASFSLVAHKETRFVFLVTPVWLVGLAALAANHGRLIATALPRLSRIAPAVAALLVAAFAVESVLGLFDRLPLESRVQRRHIAANATREAYRAIAARDDVVAVLDASGASGWYLTPYYDLHHDVPLYWPLSRGFRAVEAQPARYASHVITRRTASAPDGFRELERVGGLVIWRRIVDPPFTDEAFGYERRIHALQPVATPPTVTPRW